MSYLVKLMARQQPGSANVLAPVLGLVAALMVFAAIPFGENITWAGQMHAVQVADPGLLYVLAVLVLFFSRCDGVAGARATSARFWTGCAMRPDSWATCCPLGSAL